MNLTCWLKNIDDETPISCINIPGTHDSASRCVRSIAPHCYICQSTSVYEQLLDGARFIDIRLKCKNGRFLLVHAAANCLEDSGKTISFDKVYNDFQNFLKFNKSETIIVSVKMDFGKNSDEFFNLFYNRYIKSNEDKWFLENRIPTLCEARGRMVLARRCMLGNFDGDDCGIDLSSWEDQGNNDCSEPLECDFGNISGQKAIIQDRYRHSKEKKWADCIKPFFENYSACENVMCINFMSAAGTPKENAAYINEQFNKYRMHNKKYGIIIADFLNKDISKKIIATNEGIEL